jgi:ferredoxin-NADP reductase/uncharacterized protein YcbX
MLETWLVRGNGDQPVAGSHTRFVTARVEHLVHYPVKGLAGIELAEVHVAAGGGFPYDRAVAITNGTGRVPTDGSWLDPATLLGLARNPGLTRLRVRLTDGSGTPATITAPDGSSLRVHLDGPSDRDAELAAATTRVRSWIPSRPDGLPSVLVSRAPLWEHPDAAISIVNLATVELLGKAWGTTLDLRRFRANMYLSGLDPWEDLDLVGHRLRVGCAEFEVLRPIERCRGAGVDPGDGSTRVDVAEQLALDVGHKFLGVYARVVGRGRVRRGDGLADLGKAARPVGSGAAVARPSTDWPRRASVEAVHRESDSVVSLWFRDPLGLSPAVQPGQHVRLHAVDADGPVWRNYTVSAVVADLVRISVGLEPGGRMSEHLSAGRPEELRLVMTGPLGEIIEDPAATAPLLLLSAGIGITPTVAILRELAARSPGRPVSVLHVARSSDAALWDEARALVARLPGGDNRVALHLTRESPKRCREMGARLGRPNADHIARAVAELPGDGLVALVCGPDRFRSDMRAALLAAGVPDGSIRQEVFFSPPPAATCTPSISAGPFQVRFSGSDRQATWKPASGSLLDLAEACGLTPRVDCRVAACNVCATAVTAGSTAYTTPPMVPPPDGEVLICSAVPTSDVTVAL